MRTAFYSATIGAFVALLLVTSAAEETPAPRPEEAIAVEEEAREQAPAVDTRALKGLIGTTAGCGVFGFFGDGGPAVRAALWMPQGLSFDGRGNLYIADTMNHRIRKVGADAIITTIVGSGPSGFSKGSYAGDGGHALAARMSWPADVAVNAAGEIYIADRRNHRIRKATPDGRIATLAGTGIGGFSGDGGPAVKAQLKEPSGLALDVAGNLYIAEYANGRVRKIDRDGKISTVAGSGALDVSGDGGPALKAGVRQISDVVVDRQGTLYLAQPNDHRVRKVTPDGKITAYAGSGLIGNHGGGFSGDGGPAVKAQLKFPNSLALDGDGNLFISDGGNGRIRKVAPDGTITTIAGGGRHGLADRVPALVATLRPGGLAMDGAGNLHFSDSAAPHVPRVRVLFGAGAAEAPARQTPAEDGAETLLTPNANP